MADMSTYNVEFKYGATTADKTVKIKNFPAILAPKSAIETTCLSDEARTYILGIRETPERFDFGANWDKEVFDDINKLTAVQKCEVSFPDGAKFTWDGYISAANNEGGVNEVLEMTISVTPSTVPVFTKGA